MIRARGSGATLFAVLIAGRLAAQKPVVPLMLNHLEVVLDSATYRDVAASTFLRAQFAADSDIVDERRGGMPGIRLFGKYDWMTLSAPAGDRAMGDVMIALSTPVPGALGRLSSLLHLAATSYPPGAATDFRQALRLTATDSMSGHARFEIMQYDPHESALLAERDSLPVTNLSTARFLAAYYDRHKLFEYLSSATLAIPVGDIARIAGVLQRDSVPVFFEGQGAVIRLDSFTLHLVPPWGGAGVKQLEFALTRDVPANPSYRFGPRSRLRFGPGPTAIWDFDPHD